MGIPGGLRAKSREQDKIGAWRGMLPCYICPGFAARPSSSLPVLIIPQPGTKSLPMANTGSARWRLGKVRSQLSKFLELRRACCWLQKAEACGCCHHQAHLATNSAFWWPILSKGKTKTKI